MSRERLYSSGSEDRGQIQGKGNFIVLASDEGTWVSELNFTPFSFDGRVKPKLGYGCPWRGSEEVLGAVRTLSRPSRLGPSTVTDRVTVSLGGSECHRPSEKPFGIKLTL